MQCSIILRMLFCFSCAIYTIKLINFSNTTFISFLYFLEHSSVQIECVRAYVGLNAQNNSGYNIPYFISKLPASRTFPPSLVYLLLAGQTGLLSCSYSSCIHTYRAYKCGWSKSTRGPVAPAPFSSFIFLISSSPPALSCPYLRFRLFFRSLFYFRTDLVSLQGWK